MQSKSCRSPVLTSNNLTSGALTLDEEINAKYQRYVEMYDEEQSIQITMHRRNNVYKGQCIDKTRHTKNNSYTDRVMHIKINAYKDQWI